MIFKKMMVAVIGLVLVFCNIAYAVDTWSLVGGNVNSDRVYDIQTVTDSNGTPYVAFHDNNFSNKITVKKYDGSSWVTVGIPGFTSERPDFYRLAIDSNDNIYILHNHKHYDPMWPGLSDQAYKISVTKFNGTSWELVGAEKFANGTLYTSIAFDSNDVPYVAYSDDDNDVKGTIKKYDGSSWVNVGGTFTNAYCNTQLISLEIDSNDVLYAAYQDLNNNYKLTVKKYDGSNWGSVGAAAVSADQVVDIDLEIDSNDVPYVVYKDLTNNKATLVKYDGSDWVELGSGGFSEGNALGISLEISHNTLYVAYIDTTIESKTTVKKYNGTSWELVGDKGFSVGRAASDDNAALSLGNNSIFVAYVDADDNRLAKVMSYPLALPVTYTVTYEDNVSGETITVPTDSTDYNANDTVSIAVTEPTRTNFIFDGWTTAQDGSGTVYKTSTANDSFTITGDTTLYAQWKPIFETDGSGKITGYNGTAKDVIIPSTIDSETINEIYELAFQNKGLTSVTIPEGITAIGYKAFEGNSLTSVDIPNSVTSIASRAFFENDLTSVAIGNQVQTIGGYAFYRNSLTNVDIPDSVTTIEQAAFEGNNLTSITLGNSVDKIEAWAFQYNNLTDVTIPASVTTVSQDVFQANLMETVTFEGNSNEMNWISRMSNTILGTISTQSNLKGFVGDIDNGGPWYEGTWYEDSARKIEATDHSFSRPGPQTYYSSNYTAPTYKVTFDVETNGADGVTTTNQTASVSENTTDILSHVPADPTKTGYTFSGWFTAPSGGTKITDFGNVTAIVSNTIYYAQFAEPTNTVTFDSNGGTGISQIKVTSGSVITMPADPTKSGYTFDGWYKSEIDDNGSGNLWDFTHDTVDSDITLYAKWTAQAPAAFTVSFDSNGGSVVPSITDVKSGSAITAPTPPERSGYTFDGWYKSEIDDNGSGNAWDFTHDTVDSDVTLYAKWTAQAPAAFTVSFDSNGGSVVSSITDVRSGSAITAPTRPERNGYTFDGWYKEGALTDAWNFTTDTVTSDVTLYAKWAKKTSNSGSSGSGSSKKIVVADVEKEGNDKSIGVTGTMKSTSKKVEVQVDKASIKESIHKAEQDAVVKVKVPQETKEITTIFSVQNVKDMQKKDLTISVETKKAVYTIPTNNIDLNIVSEEFGNNVDADDIEFEVLQKESSTAMEEIIIKTAEKEDVEVLMPSIDFEVKASYKGKSVTIGAFKKYITRKIALSDGVDISKVTTATITKADGTIHHVPTYVELVDGKYYAVVNSLTNSTYTLIHNKQTYDDINMWAKNSIENMAGRLIMEGDTETLFSPNRDITRAEFTKAVVKAIGLTPVDYIEYTDVDENSDIAGYIQTASEYDIIKGKGNGLFAPDDTITRQDAMTILYRISTIIEYRGNEQNIDLSEYNDFKDVSGYAKEAVIWNINSFIINGKSAEMLDPKSNITKAEVATVLERILKKAGLI